MKYIVSIFLMVNATAWAQQSPTNLVECMRERPSFKQFCKIKANGFNPELQIASKFKLKDDREIDIANILSRSFYEEKSADDTISRLDLPGLSPILSYMIAWEQGLGGSCAASALWQHRIFAMLGSTVGRPKSLARIQNGSVVNSHELLKFQSESFHPWNVTNEAGLLKLRANLYFEDHDFVENLPVERIPADCNLTVSDIELTYDPVRINQTLQFLRSIAFTKSELLTRAYVLNANIRGQKKGAVCSVGKLSDALRNAELLGVSDSLDMLSLSSRTAIIKAIRDAKSYGALPGSSNKDDELWQYFLSPQGRTVFFDASGDKVDYKVTTEAFVSNGTIIDHEGYNNAKTYLRESRNQDEVLKSAWALIKASEVALKKASDVKWPENPDLSLHL